MSSTTPPDDDPGEHPPESSNGIPQWPAPQTPAPEPIERQSTSPVDPASPPVPAGRAGWRPWTAWAAIVTGFGVTIVGGITVSIIAAAAGGSLEDPAPGVNIGLTFFQNAALIGAALFFAHMAGRPAAADFGLRSPADGIADRRERLRALRRAAGLLLGLWIGFYIVSAIWTAALGLQDERQTLPDTLGIEGSAVNLALVVVLITVVAPVGEELFFRGYFFGALRNWKGFWPAAIITGAVFGAIHIGSSPIGFTVPLAFFGFALCLLYERTGSLYPSIALHALNNSVALGLTQGWSAEIPFVMVGSVIASLTLTRGLGRVLQARSRSGTGPFPQPAARA